MGMERRSRRIDPVVEPVVRASSRGHGAEGVSGRDVRLGRAPDGGPGHARARSGGGSPAVRRHHAPGERLSVRRVTSTTPLPTPHARCQSGRRAPTPRSCVVWWPGSRDEQRRSRRPVRRRHRRRSARPHAGALSRDDLRPARTLPRCAPQVRAGARDEPAARRCPPRCRRHAMRRSAISPRRGGHWHAPSRRSRTIRGCPQPRRASAKRKGADDETRDRRNHDLAARRLRRSLRPSHETTRRRPPAPPWFEDVARRDGMTFVHRSGPRGAALPPAGNHGRRRGALRHGRRWRPRSLLVQSGSFRASREDPAGHRLYRNRGDGTFEDVTAGSGRGTSRATAWVSATGDYDNDGDVDLYVTNAGRAMSCCRTTDADTSPTSPRAAGVAGARLEHERRLLRHRRRRRPRSLRARYLNWTPAPSCECYSLTGEPDYCSPKNYDAPTRRPPVQEQRRRHVHRHLDATPACGPRSATASALSPRT